MADTDLAAFPDGVPTAGDVLLVKRGSGGVNLLVDDFLVKDSATGALLVSRNGGQINLDSNFASMGVGAVYYDGGWRNTTTGQGGACITNNGGVFSIQTGSSPGTAGSLITDMAERFRITADGTISTGTHLPSVDNSKNSGSASYRWANGYIANAWTVSSDERIKAQIGAIPDEWLDAWGDVAWQRYKMADAVAQKGDGARWHAGLIAQQVGEAFAAYGIDASAIGLLCFDAWEAVAADDETGTPARAAGELWAIRYDEAQAIEAAWQRREIARQAARISALETALDA